MGGRGVSVVIIHSYKLASHNEALEGIVNGLSYPSEEYFLTHTADPAGITESTAVAVLPVSYHEPRYLK